MNKILLAVILAGFGSQILKLLILFFRHKKLSWHDIFVTGGMPSSHAAFVVSLATIIYLTERASTLFVMSLVFAIIVIRDAFGVRRSVGMEGKAIQQLFKIHHIKSKFHYSMGHTPLQVLVGSVIGFGTAMLVHYYFLVL